MPETVTLKWEEYEELRRVYVEREKLNETLRQIKYSSGMRMFPDGRQHLILRGYSGIHYIWKEFSRESPPSFDIIELVDSRDDPVAIYVKQD